jgi:hypothetical protein
VVEEAVAAPLSPAVDGDLADWVGAVAMRMALPEHLTKPTLFPLRSEDEKVSAAAPNAQVEGRPMATVRLAYDKNFLYVAAEVDLPRELQRVRSDSIPEGPGGSGGPWGSESIQLALAPTEAAQPAYILSLIPTPQRPMVVMMHAPSWDLRNPLAEIPLPSPQWGEVPGSRIAIVNAGSRNHNRAAYEAAIPRQALAALPWSAGDRWHIGLLVEPAKDVVVNWDETAGVFPWQTTSTGFFPIGVERRSPVAELTLGAGK